MTKTTDPWKAAWDWAKALYTNEGDFYAFFRNVARQVAEERGLEEVGSSDVWHLSYEAVKRAQDGGKVTNRAELEQAVRDYQGF